MSRSWRKYQCRFAIGVLAALIVMFVAVGAGADQPSKADVKIERVALFKNGIGHFSSTAVLPKGETVIKIGQLPIPSQGTFWVGYPDDVKIRGLFTSLEEVAKAMPARSISELLKSNLGKEVTVVTAQNIGSPLKGAILDVLLGNASAELPSPYIMGMLNPASDKWNQSYYRSSSLVLIKTKSGTVALDAGTILRADFEGNDISMSASDEIRQPSIRIELEKASKGQEVGISYLARGITWSPSYLIDISDSNLARLSAKATIINEVADMDDIHLSLITGYPNIRFGEVNDPVAMSQDLGGFLKALSAGRSEPNMQFSNAMTAQVAYGGMIGAESNANSLTLAYPEAQDGVISEDLFLYPIEHFTLRRGETACMPLFTAEMPYKHIYIWKIPDMLDENERYNRNFSKDVHATPEEVWHCCRIVNNMNIPWTTSAAEFVKNGQFTGQEICYYTPSGAETTIRINRAMNVPAEQTELELERQRDATSFHGYSYDLVKIRGEMKLQNRLDKDITVEVTKNISGVVHETLPQAKDIQSAKELKQVNSRHVLVWSIKLKAGQEQKLSYTYDVYVSN